MYYQHMLKNLRGLKLAVCLSSVLALCAIVNGCAPITMALPVIIAAVQGADIAINLIESFVASYYKGHPNPDHEKKCGELIAKTRIALAAVLDIANAVGDINQAKLDDAFKQFEAAYNELTAFVGPLGVHVGTGGMRAAPGELTVPPASAFRPVRR
jgi:hypothetical protein